MVSSVEERFKFVFQNDWYSKAVILDPKTKGNMWFSERRKTRTIELLRNEIVQLKVTAPTKPEESPKKKITIYDQIFGATQNHTIANPTEIDKWILELPGTKHCSNRIYFSGRLEYKAIPVLYRMYCSTPATAVSVEQLWSEAGYLTERRRSSMSSVLLVERLFYKKNVKLYLKISSNLMISADTSHSNVDKFMF